MLTRATEVLLPLVSKGPDYQRMLGVGLRELARAQLERQEDEPAEMNLLDSRVYLEELVQRFPTNAGYEADLQATIALLAEVSNGED